MPAWSLELLEDLMTVTRAATACSVRRRRSSGWPAFVNLEGDARLRSAEAARSLS
jgi:hypothetical protein